MLSLSQGSRTRLGFAEAMVESLLGCFCGPVYCGQVAYVTIPLGMLAALLVRAFGASLAVSFALAMVFNLSFSLPK